MASYRQRGSSVEAVIRRKGHRPLSKCFKSKTQAQAWAMKQEALVLEGHQVQTQKRITFQQALDKYVADYFRKKKAYRHEKGRLKFIGKMVGHMYLDAITALCLSDYRSKRAKEVAAASVNKELAYIHRVLTYAVLELGVLLQYGVPRVSKLRLPKGRDRRVTESELQKIIQQSESTMQVIIQLALETGMRRGELVKIKRKDINYRSRTVQLYDTKNGEDRVVPLSTVAIRALKQLPARINGEVFGIHPDTVSKRFCSACRVAGIEDLRFHDLRHEAVSRLFEKGLNPMEVSTISGHKTLQMLKRYTHLKAEDLAKKLG
jgi:integrase